MLPSDTLSNTDANSHPNSYPNANRNSDSLCYVHPNTHADAYANTHSHANTHADANANPYPGSSDANSVAHANTLSSEWSADGCRHRQFADSYNRSSVQLGFLSSMSLHSMPLRLELFSLSIQHRRSRSAGFAPNVLSLYHLQSTASRSNDGYSSGNTTCWYDWRWTRDGVRYGDRHANTDTDTHADALR